MSALRVTSSASSAFCGAKGARSLNALPSRRQASPPRRSSSSTSTVRVQALFGGNKSDDEGSQSEGRATLSREEEPEEYWVSAAEKKGANPFKDPLAWVGIAAIFLPFALLGWAVATGLVDVSVYR